MLADLNVSNKIQPGAKNNLAGGGTDDMLHISFEPLTATGMPITPSGTSIATSLRTTTGTMIISFSLVT